MTRAKPESVLKPKQIAVSVAACFALHAPLLLANPSVPTVVHGGVGFSGLGTSALTITNTAGGNAIINWNGFSIGINEITKFQQFANLAVLNRVTGSELSSILGALKSDGRVFLINPNGIIFGANSRIDTAGMVASSLALSDQDFLANRLRFTEVPGAGAVVNNGIIQTVAGSRVYLVAPTVENNGLIQTPQGAVVLAAGKEVELVDANTPFVTVKLAAATDSALNIGNIIADSGRIGMFGALVRNSGTISANSVVAGPGGEIRLVASRDLTLDAGSTVTANGASGGKVLLQAEGGTNLVGGTVEAKGSAGKGGEVQALGVRVGVVGHGVIDASGDTGGGTVLVGGDYQGKNAAVQNAERTYVGTDGVIRADAMTTGDGGRVIVWADKDTEFYGAISVKGGAQSGNGGFVETSGKGALQAFGSVNVSAPNGVGGNWLLDPTDITIVAGGLEAYGACGANMICWPDVVSSVGVDAINNAMAGNGFIQIQATNDINLQASLTLTYGGSVSMEAGNNINLGVNGISTIGNLTLLAAAPGAVAYGGSATTGAITSSPGGGNITTSGGSLDAQGWAVNLGNINTSGSSNAGSVNLASSNGNVATGGITTGGGSVVVNAANGAISVGGLISTSSTLNPGDTFGNGSVSVTASGNITTASIVTASPHPVHGDGGYVRLATNNGVISVNGMIDTRGAPGSLVAVDTCNDGCMETFSAGSDGGGVSLVRTAQDGFAGTAVRVNGDILTTGGNGASGTAVPGQDHSGGWGGYVLIGGDDCSGDCSFVNAPLAGSVSVAGVSNTSGGHGGSVTEAISGTEAGSAGQISVWSYGSIGIGGIVSRGGNAGNGADGSAYGNDGGWGGSLQLYSDAGSVAIGSIDNSGGAGGNAGGSAYGSYSIGGWGGSAGYTQIRGATGVNIGAIVARGANGGAGGNASGYLYANGGDGGEGSSLYLNSLSGPVSIGSIDMSGAHGGVGGAAAEYVWGGSGGDGGYLDVFGTAVSISSIVGRGGNGAAGGTATGGVFPYGYGGSGGRGTNVYVSATGPVSIGSADVSGGHAGAGGTATQYAWGGSGGYAGYFDVVNASSIDIGPIAGRGGDGASGGTGIYANGGSGGRGSSINLNSTGPVTTGAMDILGGRGGNGGAAVLYGYGGNGYYGGSVSITGTSIATGAIMARGADGGTGGTISDSGGNSSGGMGGMGGSVSLNASSYGGQVSIPGPVSTGMIDISGGNGGNSGAMGSSLTSGGWGGSGGGAFSSGVYISGSTIDVSGPILAGGGKGGDVLNQSLSANGTPGSTAGSGGNGGRVNVQGTGEISINDGGALGTVSIDVSGGAGGNGNAATSPAGNGGTGGAGGTADLIGTPNMTMFGSVNAAGGAGGNGGAGNGANVGGSGGNGGNAGFIYLDASSVTDTQIGDGIIFVLAGTQFNVQGGAGGVGGTDGGVGAGAGAAAGRTGTFNSMSDYFGTIVILDPLSIPEVNANFQQTVKAFDESTDFVGGEDEEKDENKSKKEFSSCKA